jgi:hypothetical protein
MSCPRAVSPDWLLRSNSDVSPIGGTQPESARLLAPHPRVDVDHIVYGFASFGHAARG